MDGSNIEPNNQLTEKKANDMKTKRLMIPMMASTLAGLGFAAGQVVEKHEQAEAKAEAKAEASGEGSHVERKTVTVTSENGRTVRKTTTFRNGKETTKTEILDGDGKVIAGGDEGGGDEAQGGPAEDEGGPWIGLRVQEAPGALRDQVGLAEDEGVVVDAIAPDGPAAKAGLRVNDVLLKLDEVPLGKPEDLKSALEGREAGARVTVEYLRRGARAKVEVTLEEKPEDGGDEGGPPPGGQGMNEDGGAGAKVRPGTIEVEVSGNAGEGLDGVLENPDVPEEFKKSVREMQEKMREFEKKHGKP